MGRGNQRKDAEGERRKELEGLLKTVETVARPRADAFHPTEVGC